MRMRSGACVVLLGIAMLGCEAGGGGGASGTIGSAGGKVEASDGTQIDVPAGALSRSIEIVIAPNSEPALPAALHAVGPAYTFGPEGLTFEHPATVILPFDPARLPAGKRPQDLVIYTAPVDSTAFVALETVVVDATHIRATTPHFSVFVAATPGEVVASDGGVDARVPDAQVTDARVADAQVMDARIPDGGVRDGAIDAGSP